MSSLSSAEASEITDDSLLRKDALSKVTIVFLIIAYAAELAASILNVCKRMFELYLLC